MVVGDCCALVVREEYWDRQFRVCAELHGIKLGYQQIKQAKVVIVDVAKRAGEVIRMLIEQMNEVLTQVFVVMKGTLVDTIEALSKFVEECEITFDDDFYTICDKLENKMLYLNKQQCIKNEQYYKSQFRLAKMNYNVLHHDRRC